MTAHPASLHGAGGCQRSLMPTAKLQRFLMTVTIVATCVGTAPAVAQTVTVVPTGNRLAEQPVIPRASALRSKAFNTTYEEKYRAITALLRDDRKLVGKIRKAALAYGIDPIHIVAALVGEHTYNISVVDSVQTYYVKALAYADLKFSFSYRGTPVQSFVQRPEFASCSSLESSALIWSCRDQVWEETFRGRKVDGVDHEPITFQRAFFQPFYAGQTFGLGQISPLAALQVTDMVSRVSKLPRLSPDRPQAIYRDVMDPDRSLVYIAAIIRDSIDAYREQGFDISGNPGITATLYNVGQPRRRARELRQAVTDKTGRTLPVENYYGWLINDRLEVLKALLTDGTK
ncbi:DUF1402 family protein [Mesorhizobium sp. M0019]|uniref:DUF1402 family protein n=1 Tax=Mesorhizobium sp. M0019 TaxID=2956845 RepID=UPI00333AB465